MSFKPNSMTFAEGVERLQRAAKAAGVRGGAILTSRDEAAKKATKQLAVTNVPPGFTNWQFPVFLEGPSQQFFTYGAPNAEVGTHSHDEGDGIRVILSGSIIYNGVELHEGDWMYIPKGEPYEFKVGPRGAGMFYCYRCCCA